MMFSAKRFAGLSSVLACATLSLAWALNGHFNAQIVVLDELVQKPVALTDFLIIPASGGETKKIRTDAEGKISIDLAAGRYRLESASPLSYKGKAYSWSSDFEVKDDQTSSLTLTQADAKFEEQSARRVSDEARIYQRYRRSVMTVQADTGHGSGFLISRDGLVLTNSHVVHGSLSIAVRVDKSERYRATVLVDDPVSDTAVIRISSEVAATMEPLSLLPPAETIAIEGEKVIAIGSPLNQEKTLTQGIVSKVEKDVLISDVNINHGNSGGPLLNLDGQVIGITTFGDFTSQGGPGISGIVSIRKADAVIDQAKEKMAAGVAPTGDRLPDISDVQIPDDVLREEALKIKDEAPFLKAPRNFRSYIETPFTAMSAQVKYEKEVAKKVSRRYKNRKGPDGKEAVVSGTPQAYWLRYVTSINDAVVRIRILPWPQETGSSQWRGAFGAVLGVRTHKTLELRDDFREAALFRNGVLVEPILRNRIQNDVAYEILDTSINDSAYAGVYTYDPMAFEPNGQVELRVWKNDRTEYESVKIDKGTLEKIWKPFASWAKLLPSAKTGSSKL